MYVHAELKLFKTAKTKTNIVSENHYVMHK